MRKIVVTFTIALSLGAASTIANAQPAAPATTASAAASTTPAANNQTTAAKTSTPAAAQNSAPASSSAQVVVPPKGDNKSDKDPSDKDKQSNKDKSGQNQKSGNKGVNAGSTLGVIAAIVAVLGLVGGGIFWAIQQNLIPNIQLPNIPGLPTNIPNPFAPPAPAPAPAPTSSAAPAPVE
jgi:hypothetical protein